MQASYESTKPYKILGKTDNLTVSTINWPTVAIKLLFYDFDFRGAELEDIDTTG